MFSPPGGKTKIIFAKGVKVWAVRLALGGSTLFSIYPHLTPVPPPAAGVFPSECSSMCSSFRSPCVRRPSAISSPLFYFTFNKIQYSMYTHCAVAKSLSFFFSRVAREFRHFRSFRWRGFCQISFTHRVNCTTHMGSLPDARRDGSVSRCEIARVARSALALTHARAQDFIVMVGVHVRQSICTVAFVHSLTNISDPGAVSRHKPIGSP